MNEEIKRFLVSFLRAIPQSNQTAARLAHLARTSLTEYEAGILMGYATFLDMLGIVHLEIKDPPEQSCIRARSQTAKYTLMSMASYVESDLPIVEDWKTRGIQPDNLLATGASFLYLLESRRLEKLPNSQPSREVKVAQALIKRVNPENGTHEILFQFDPAAGQYQLIGGRCSEQDGDDLLKTMIREIEEELSPNHLVYGKDYQLQLLTDELDISPALSPTFGALTRYDFHIFYMTDLQEDLKLQAVDKWISVTQVLKGTIIDDDNCAYPFRIPETYTAMDAAIPGGLLGLASSFVD